MSASKNRHFKMKRRARWIALALGMTSVVALTVPVFGEKKPQSLLPPGFDAPAQPAPKADVPPVASPASPASAPVMDGGAPSAPLDAAGDSHPASRTNIPASETTDAAAATTPAPSPYDLPAHERLSLKQIGVIDDHSGGVAADAFGATLNGRTLEHIMRYTKAPIASRWVSIVLRRVLLSNVNTPQRTAGADWAAERAWLLLRMGEADAARMLIQRVDSDNYSPKLYAVAMQSALANADLASLCPIVANARRVSDDPAWDYSLAICASLSNEAHAASSLLKRANASSGVPGIDQQLAERVIGAGKNSQHSVTIEWDNVSQLNAWRFGAATAVGLPIPATLYESARPNVRAWAARAPLLKPSDRVDAADWAAAFGVYSNAALVDFYSSFYDDPAATNSESSPQGLLRNAYSAESMGGRIAAMKALWTGAAADDVHRYARLILTARAAAHLPVDQAYAANIDQLAASMMTAGLDVQAARWGKIVGNNGDDASRRAWGLLAVGAPNAAVALNMGAINNYGTTGELRQKFLIASLIGLGRVDMKNGVRLAADHNISLNWSTKWTRAIDQAAQRGEKGTVSILAAAGMQNLSWQNIPAEHLYHIVRAFKAVGLEPEARMVAAEALTRA